MQTMTELETALRKFKAARKKLEEMYPEKYTSITLSVTKYSKEGSGDTKLRCNIYMKDFPRSFEAASWEDAFKQIAEKE